MLQVVDSIEIVEWSAGVAQSRVTFGKSISRLPVWTRVHFVQKAGSTRSCSQVPGIRVRGQVTLKYIRDPEISGAATARNQALRHSRGDVNWPRTASGVLLRIAGSVPLGAIRWSPPELPARRIATPG
jgi:hypothetical protein